MLNQPETHRRPIVIIGGGIAGLTVAHRLVELADQTDQQIDVVLLEASSRLGGVLKTENRGGFLIEAGADSFISEKPEAIELAKRIGLESHLIQTNKDHRRSFIVRNGRLRPVPEGFQLLAPSRLWPFITVDPKLGPAAVPTMPRDIRMTRADDFMLPPPAFGVGSAAPR